MRDYVWNAKAPSNIALIKYMGKSDGNLPLNTSLSYTLHDYVSITTLSVIDAAEDAFRPLDIPGFMKLNISPAGEQKFKKHLSFLKDKFDCKEKFQISSCNNFPSDAGIASSASSFASLTKCFAEAIRELKGICLSSEEMSALSRNGSGSSCRSFFAPWAIWSGETAEAIDIPYDNLIHQMILVDTKHKSVSSSDAHSMVRSSLLYGDRPTRANKRLTDILCALRSKDWEKVFDIAWAEFCDMHALFSTSTPHFQYISWKTVAALTMINDIWKERNDGPVVTIDAGPNVHLLWRQDQQKLMEELSEQLRIMDIL